MTAVQLNIETLRERVAETINRERDHIIEVAETIRVNPEVGYQEVMASRLLADHLREAGFEVEKPYKGLETAFRATRRTGRPGPAVAVLAEYDALAGIGHGCGHNLIAGSGLAAALGISSVTDHVGGSVVVIGTPAEEGGGGKVKLAEAGAFDDLDAVLMLHHGGHETSVATSWPNGTTLAVTHFDIEYFGKPAHSAADPENGVNALNALIHFFTGLDALRQHVTHDVRMHGIITHGGEAANVVPRYTKAKMYARAASQDALAELMVKINAIAEGAALMTGCVVKLHEENTYLDMRPSYVLGSRYEEHLKRVGLDLSPDDQGRAMGSTDLGNVSYVVPSACAYFAISDVEIPGHSQEVVEASGSSFGYDQLIKTSTAMTFTLLDLLTDPALSQEAWDEHRQWLERYEKTS
jgi:amidohydrolase